TFSGLDGLDGGGEGNVAWNRGPRECWNRHGHPPTAHGTYVIPIPHCIPYLRDRFFHKTEKAVDRFEAMSAFVAVVEAGGFSAASRRLGVPLASVSRRVSDLEDRLGVQLLTRSTPQGPITHR